MKRKILTILLSIIILINTVSSINAKKCNDGNSWYCVHRDDMKQPECPAEMSYIEKYNGYYVDKSHSDDNYDKVIYLTFDAGYENGNVERILDILKEKKVTGAFFILENLIEREPELVKRMGNEGNLVCNHTATHKDMSKINSKEEFLSEVDRLNNKYKELTGSDMPKFFRPPEGRASENTMKLADECGYKTVFWSFAYADWDNNKQMNGDRAIEKIISGTHNGMIILLHPTSETNAGIMGTLIDKWRDMGYRFGSLEELK